MKTTAAPESTQCVAAAIVNVTSETSSKPSSETSLPPQPSLSSEAGIVATSKPVLRATPEERAMSYSCMQSSELIGGHVGSPASSRGLNLGKRRIAQSETSTFQSQRHLKHQVSSSSYLPQPRTARKNKSAQLLDFLRDGFKTQQHSCQALEMAREHAILVLQRWFRNLREHWRLVKQVQEATSQSLLLLLEAAEASRAGSWATEWEAMCRQGSLEFHACHMLQGLGFAREGQAADNSLTHPMTLLSALLISVHPEAITTASPVKSKRRRREHERRGIALVQAASRVHETLLALYHCLHQAKMPRWLMLRAVVQVQKAFRLYVVQRVRYQGVSGAEAARLVRRVTHAAVGVFKAMHRSQRKSQVDAAQAIECAEAIIEGEARLRHLEAALQQLVGQRDTARHMDMARQVAEEGKQWDGKIHGRSELKPLASDQDETLMSMDSELEEESHASGDTQTDAIFSDEWLVHEICVLPKSRFLQVSMEDASQPFTCGNKPSQGDTQAYWEKVTQTLLMGDFSPFLVLVQELADRLISMTPSRADLKDEILGSLDVALLKQVLSKDLLDSQLLFSILRFAGRRILCLEAPARNASTEKWLVRLKELEDRVVQQAGGPCVRLSLQDSTVSKQWVPSISPLFEFLFEKVDQIHVDIFNSHIRRATPHCRAHGPSFERSQFEERLAQGFTSVDRVLSWLRRVVASEWCQEQSMPVSSLRHGDQRVALLEGVRQQSGEAMRTLLRRAYASLLADSSRQGGSVSVFSEDDLPETLAIDAQRLGLARHALWCVASAGTVVAYLGQALGRQLRAEERQIVVQELMVLLPEADVEVEDISLHVGHIASTRLGMTGAGERKMMEERVRRLLQDGRCPVFQLLYQRAVDVVHAVLEREESTTEDQSGRVAHLCQQQGLTGMESRILKICDVMLLVTRHNEACFLSLYQKLVSEALRSE